MTIRDEARQEAERRYPELNPDVDGLTYPRSAIGGMTRGAFEDGAVWAYEQGRAAHARAEVVEAKLAQVRERLVHLADAQQSWINAGRHEQAISREAIRDRAREIVAVIDGEGEHADPS